MVLKSSSIDATYFALVIFFVPMIFCLLEMISTGNAPTTASCSNGSRVGSAKGTHQHEGGFGARDSALIHPTRPILIMKHSQYHKRGNAKNASYFEFDSFEFVSDFVLRISSLPFRSG